MVIKQYLLQRLNTMAIFRKKESSVLIDDCNIQVKHKPVKDVVLRFKVLVAFVDKFDDLHRELFTEEMTKYLDTWSNDLQIKF